MMRTVYLINSDPDSFRGVREYLELEEYAVKEFRLIKSALSAIERRTPDAVILDLEFEDGSGFSLLKKIRLSYSFAIIILTKRDDESDRILGFELGCDDYITIPFSHKELLLRLKAILKREGKEKKIASDNDSWEIDGNTLTLDRERHEFYLNGNKVDLTASEWKILSYLIENESIVISRERILEYCFSASIGYDRVIDTHIKNIRTKIGKAWIETVRSYGYKFRGIQNNSLKS